MHFFLLLSILVIAFVAVIWTQKNHFRIARSIIINARPDAIFPEINNFINWNAWSPWAKMDLNCKNTFEGAPEGVGSVFKWDGNRKVGAGMMTIIESRPNDLVKIDIQFFKPFKGRNVVDFILTDQGNETLLTWGMSGKNNFLGKLMNLIMNCDKMIGGQFNKGLADIKTVAENKGK